MGEAYFFGLPVRAAGQQADGSKPDELRPAFTRQDEGRLHLEPAVRKSFILGSPRPILRGSGLLYGSWDGKTVEEAHPFRMSG